MYWQAAYLSFVKLLENKMQASKVVEQLRLDQSLIQVAKVLEGLLIELQGLLHHPNTVKADGWRVTVKS